MTVQRIAFCRYPDGCFAVKVGKQRGPCASSRVLALRRYSRSGLIARADSDGGCQKRIPKYTLTEGQRASRAASRAFVKGR
jgi:hypothetical protein